ncbi:MAG: hypothetical protein IJ685_07575 [Selenomonadaceae bacterium]|nr:hypothetical protein [Selenomonadaceae bacterium]
MSKPGSGHFHGTNGKGGGSAPPLFNNGHVTYEGIAAHREEFMNKSVEQIADLLKENGYEIRICPSNRQNKGSTAMIIEITNPSKERNIDQVQISPDGSKHHGNVPYVKLSTSNEGLIKVIDGTREQYRTDGTEKARLIFKRDSE